METTLLKMFCSSNPDTIRQKATEFAQGRKIISANAPKKVGSMFYFCMEYEDLVDEK